MTDVPLSPEEQDIALAGEFVLRLLSVQEEETVRQRLQTDQQFSGLVQGWENQFAQIAETIDEVAPSAAQRRIILQKLVEDVVTPTPRGNWWRILFGAVAILGFVLLLIWGSTLLRTQSAPIELIARNGAVSIYVSVSQDERLVRTELAEGRAPAGRSLQLWAMPTGQSPLSIGVLPSATRAEFVISEDVLAILNESFLALSVEVLGGSQTGEPSDQIIAISGTQ